MNEKELTKLVCEYIKLQYPETIFTIDTSGIRLTIGQATQMKSLRSDRGLPDLMIFEPRGKYHALFIELKREGEIIRNRSGELKTEHLREQNAIHERLNAKGYYAAFACSFTEAKIIIDTYMHI